MKHGLIGLFLAGLGFGTVVAWQQLLTTLLQNGGCEVVVSNADSIQIERTMGALLLLICYPISLQFLRQVSRFIRGALGSKAQVGLLTAFVVGANLSALLRTTIIAKHNLSDAFAEAVNPTLDLVTFEITTWMFYGVLSALVMVSVILVPIAVIGRQDDEA